MRGYTMTDRKKTQVKMKDVTLSFVTIIYTIRIDLQRHGSLLTFWRFTNRIIIIIVTH